MELIDLRFEYFLVKFDRDSDIERALTGGPWVIMNHYLTVQRWVPGSRPSSAQVTTTMAWVRIPELYIAMYKEEVLYSIALSIGQLIKQDRNTYWTARGRFACFCVELDLTNSLVSAVELDRKMYNVQNMRTS